MDLPDKTEKEPKPKALPEKKVEPVEGVKLVKRPASKRFFDSMIAESPKVIMGRVASEVLIPRFKAGLEEMGNAFLAGVLWGNGTNRPISQVVKGTVIRGGHTNYQGVSSMGQDPRQLARAAASRTSTGNYQDILCDTQQRAEQILASLYDRLNEYRVVTVGDLYDEAGITAQISDSGYGWTSLEGARIVHQRDGYVLALPRPSLI